MTHLVSRLALAASLFVLLAWDLPELSPEALSSQHLASIERRPADAGSGSAFAERTWHLPFAERQRAAVVELLAGNVPEHLRAFVPVRLERVLDDHETHHAVVFVSPDYLAVGSDTDFLRIPLDLPSATEVASHFRCVLPTTRIVDAVHAQAVHVLQPRPLPAGPYMRSNAWFVQHQALVQAQLPGRPDGALVAGDKKDVVLTRRLVQQPGRVAIYGWHYPDGRAIQPLTTVHGASYADYSHGLRLVSEIVVVDGRALSIYDILEDPLLAPLLSKEGPLPEAWNLMHAWEAVADG